MQQPHCCQISIYYEIRILTFVFFTKLVKSQQQIINNFNIYVLPIRNENRKLESKSNQED